MRIYTFGTNVMFPDLIDYAFKLFNKAMTVYQEDIHIKTKFTI